MAAMGGRMWQIIKAPNASFMAVFSTVKKHKWLNDSKAFAIQAVPSPFLNTTWYSNWVSKTIIYWFWVFFKLRNWHWFAGPSSNETSVQDGQPPLALSLYINTGDCSARCYCAQSDRLNDLFHWYDGFCEEFGFEVFNYFQ